MKSTDFKAILLFSLIGFFILSTLTFLSVYTFNNFIKGKDLKALFNTQVYEEPNLPSTNTLKPKSTIKVSPTVTNKTTKTFPTTSSCLTFQIKGYGAFDSNKCYPKEIFNELSQTLFQYKSEQSKVLAYEKSVEFLCDSDNDMFEESCERNKDLLKTSQIKLEELESKLEELISKGK